MSHYAKVIKHLREQGNAKIEASMGAEHSELGRKIEDEELYAEGELFCRAANVLLGTKEMADQLTALATRLSL